MLQRPALRVIKLDLESYSIIRIYIIIICKSGEVLYNQLLSIWEIIMLGMIMNGDPHTVKLQIGL